MLNELSIIVPTFNEEKYLPKLLNSIIEQHFTGKLQIVVVDGQSNDTTVKVAQSFKNKISDLQIIQTKRGISHQRNLGVKRAKYNHLLFVDADIILSKNFLSRLAKKKTTQSKFIYSFFIWGSEVDFLDNLTLVFLYSFFLPIVYFEKVTPGGVMFTTKTVHTYIGGFNEKFSLAEDLDYGKRAIAKGVKHHFFLAPYALHSTRRLRKMGRLNFFLLYVTTFFYMKKHGLASIGNKVSYPFGQYK